MQRHGALIEWTSEPLPGCGCSIISIQAMSESWEERFPDEDLAMLIDRARRKRRRGNHG